MTDPFLENEYNVRARRADFEDLVADWVARSDRARADLDVRADLQYGEGERLRLDLFRCGDPGAPTLVYIHGGYWQRHDKSIYGFLAEPFVASGVNVAIPSYDLCPDTTIPRITEQVRSAVTWLWLNAGDQGIARERINLSGHSAGGHLTAMLLAMGLQSPAPDSDEPLVRTAIPISGLYELGPLRRTSINDAVGIDDNTEACFSPARLPPRSRVPVMAALGGLESDEFHRQTGELVTAWSMHGLEIVQYTEPGVDHFDVINRLADPGSEFFTRTLAWLR